MRIVAGEFRGRALAAPAGDGTRPTTDRVREALMSSLFSLRGGWDDAVVLDAFAGSGALGLEALSRGARSAVFFEQDRKAAEVVRGNVRKCKVDSRRARVVCRDVMKADLSLFGAPFNLVFLDPPYADAAADIVSLVQRGYASGGIDPHAVVVYEHALKDAPDVASCIEEAGFSLVGTRKYGKTGVTLFVAPSA